MEPPLNKEMDEYLDEEKWRINELYSEFVLQYLCKTSYTIRNLTDLTILRLAIAYMRIFDESTASYNVCRLLEGRYNANILLDAVTCNGVFKTIIENVIANRYTKTSTYIGDIISMSVDVSLTVRDDKHRENRIIKQIYYNN